MKKFTLIILVAILSFAACQDVETTLVKENILSAVIEQDDLTRTEMDENNNVLWSENDQIIAFLKTSYGHKYKVKPSFIGKSYADFSMVSSNSGNDLSAGNEWEHNVAYYPYTNTIECLKSGNHYVLDVVLPSEQAYVPESFGNGSMAMVAVSEDNNITFNNVLGGIKLQFKGTQKVKSITLKGKNNEKLSGSATVTAYTNDTKPAVTMDSNASTSVTLNCDEGVQLNESKSTEFIITLPPVVFSKGFIVTLTDSESNIYIVETDKANTVLRSRLLVMPDMKIGTSEGEDSSEDDEQIISVVNVKFDKTSLVLPTEFSTALNVKVIPTNAVYKSVNWSSDDPSIVNVDQLGVITTLTSGVTNINATINGVVGICQITVVTPNSSTLVDYVDEYGINRGKGVVIGSTIWAPVNCGYHETAYNYGKYYQWGRKHGQGYSPETIEGPIVSTSGQDEEYANYMILTLSDYENDWVYPQNDALWNKGTESMPIKTNNDPCPKGWRVPTFDELSELLSNGKKREVYLNGQYGHCLSGPYTYLDGIPQLFIPYAGYHHTQGYRLFTYGIREDGYYWSATPAETDAYYLHVARNSSSQTIGSFLRGCAYSVRCVQE